MEEDYELLQNLYEKYFDDVYQYILYFTNSRADAEDLTQDTFFKVIKSLKRFNHQSSIKTWILSIAKHTCIDYYRKKKFISVLPSILTNIQRSNHGVPEDKMNNNEDWEVLQRALLTLKPDFRNVVILRGLKEYSIRETAEILNWKESKVKVDYHRAMQLLKVRLQKSSKGAEKIYEQEIQ